MSFEDYIKRITSDLGHSLEFLKKINLDTKAICNKSNLIYTIRDENGSAIAFSTHNLKYEQDKVEYNQKLADIGAMSS